MSLNTQQYRTKLFIAIISIACLFACKKTREEPTPVDVPTTRQDPELFNPPSYFPTPVYNFASNPLTKEKVQLGKMLFYDPILSADSTIACSNCHQPFAAFSHLSHSLSHGIKRKVGTRNAPGIYNLAWSPDFMWDGGIKNLDLLPISPIGNPVEMGSSVGLAVEKLNRTPHYQKLFKDVWQVEKIESTHILKSLSQFMLTIVSSNSKYDQYKQVKANLSDNEISGMLIVQQKCAPCHGGELFTDHSIRNIGIDSTAGSKEDVGLQLLTLNPKDRRKFKTPSLRNFSLTSPYLHNGTAYSLQAVLDRHDSLVDNTPTLDPLMIIKGTPGIHLTQDERFRIYDFLKTLTDNTLLTNPAFATPFDHYAPDH